MAHDHMYGTSFFVDNRDEFVETYSRNFGIWPISDWAMWDHPESGMGNRIAWCTVADPALAPTRFAVFEPTDPNQWMAKWSKQQLPCPYRFHCFGVAVDDLDLLIRHFDHVGVTYHITTEVINANEKQIIAGRRLFVGRPRTDLFEYDSSFDGNARMEFISVKEIPLFARSSRPAPSVASLRPGSFVRIESWSLLVDDIYQAILMFGKNFLLWPEPGSTIRDIPEDGVKSIMIPIGVRESAKLELISPYDFNKPIGKWFKKYGKRMYHIRFLVKDLDTRLSDLEAKGVAFDFREPGNTLSYKRALIDPAHTLGANLEFADYEGYTGMRA